MTVIACKHSLVFQYAENGARSPTGPSRDDGDSDPPARIPLCDTSSASKTEP